MIFALPLPTRRLVAVLILVAPLWIVPLAPGGVPVAVIALLTVALLCVADAFSTPAPWQIEVAREVPEELGLGDSESATYRVRSRATRALEVALYDALPSAVASDAPRATWLTIEREEARPIPFTVTGRQRGRYALGPVVLRVLGRFGLVQRSFRTPLTDSVHVVPSYSGVRRYRLLALQHRLRDAGIRSIRRRGDGTSFSHLREYVIGDDPRRIDWKATARRDRLMAREYTVEQGQTVVIAIDAGRLMTQLVGGVPRFDYALSAATLLADVVTQSGDKAGLIVFDDEIRAFVPPGPGRETLQRIRAALIPVTATMAEPDYAAAFRTLAARCRKRSLIVLFTDVIDPRASQAVIAHTARSAARHLLLVVALRNDQLIMAAVPSRDSTARQIYESAAAEELVLAREEALARMRHAGVIVLDVSPHESTAAVINRYLEIKARSSL